MEVRNKASIWNCSDSGPRHWEIISTAASKYFMCKTLLKVSFIQSSECCNVFRSKPDSCKIHLLCFRCAKEPLLAPGYTPEPLTLWSPGPFQLPTPSTADSHACCCQTQCPLHRWQLEELRHSEVPGLCGGLMQAVATGCRAMAPQWDGKAVSAEVWLMFCCWEVRQESQEPRDPGCLSRQLGHCNWTVYLRSSICCSKAAAFVRQNQKGVASAPAASVLLQATVNWKVSV